MALWNRGQCDNMAYGLHTDQCGELRAETHIPYAATGVCTRNLLAAPSPPKKVQPDAERLGETARTVSNFTSVDLPAPLGPMIPTRL